jgi:hypothetical protein
MIVKHLKYTIITIEYIIATNTIMHCAASTTYCICRKENIHMTVHLLVNVSQYLTIFDVIVYDLEGHCFTFKCKAVTF